MDTKIWDFSNQNDINNNVNVAHINEIASIYNEGGLIALPTETVYGLGADARNDEAIKKIYEAKGRPSDNPLIVHIYDMDQMKQFTTNLTENVKILMKHFWPGPISFILPLKEGYLCDRVSGGLGSIAVRMPSHPVGRAILKQVYIPIAAPSANLSGRPSPTTFDHVFNDLNGRIDGIIKAEQSEEGLESTVLDCTQYPYRIARPGSVTKQMIEQILPGSIEDKALNTEKPIAPGMKYKHYSPDTHLTIVRHLERQPNTEKDWTRTAFILPKDHETFVPNQAKFIPLCNNKNDIKGANHNLYQILHELDKNEDIQNAYIYGFDINDQTTAIMNRIMKAANQTIVEGETL
ncbi:L-threonylcarbamoyladenylate synthase [Staphylococcus gallinarum]|uniref:L-threonylcarbamoyladenylate synthase n=1 Tax=Staphylococcus gallinarum TaxID=1293 RepID=UPI000E6A6E44|nr:L-threonylcarbamoyladenylate synthase [Staphylococcus gallinarum]RIL26104.1 threonylcarbamoyl-AMP synthase [Staphylococcus gallinarum]